MTPQLLQAIKLLQLSNLELAAFVEQELEKNPLLERSDETPAAVAGEEPVSSKQDDFVAESEDFGEAPEDSRDGDWANENLQTSQSGLEEGLGTEVENTFDAVAAQIGAFHVFARLGNKPRRMMGLLHDTRVAGWSWSGEDKALNPQIRQSIREFGAVYPNFYAALAALEKEG